MLFTVVRQERGDVSEEPPNCPHENCWDQRAPLLVLHGVSRARTFMPPFPAVSHPVILGGLEATINKTGEAEAELKNSKSPPGPLQQQPPSSRPKLWMNMQKLKLWTKYEIQFFLLDWEYELLSWDCFYYLKGTVKPVRLVLNMIQEQKITSPTEQI